MSIIGLLSRKKMEVLSGGRFNVYASILETLFSRLSRLAHLVFFVDGFVQQSKYPTWTERQEHKYRDNISVLDKIYQNQRLSDFGGRFFLNTSKFLIEELAIKYGELKYAVSLECDQELARFASNNFNVLAVFSNDTDFLIFANGGKRWRYFSTNHLNVKTLTTKEYSRKALRYQLKLSDYQLSIMATIAGNDLIRFQEVQKWHKESLKLTTVEQKFPALAEYVRTNFPEHADHMASLKKLADEIFKDTSDRCINRILASIKSYSTDFNEIKPDDPTLRYCLQHHHLFSFNVFNRSPFNFSMVFFDLRKTDMPSYYDLSVPMLQRQAGVLQASYQLNYGVKLIVYGKRFHIEKHQPHQVSPIMPFFDVPPIEELYSESNKYDALRMKLLKWTVDWKKLKHFDLEEIPDRYMIDVLTLVFLLRKNAITSKEADILLWTIKNAENKTIPSNMLYSEHLSARGFRVAFLYTKIYTNVMRSIEVCGLKRRYWVS